MSSACSRYSARRSAIPSTALQAQSSTWSRYRPSVLDELAHRAVLLAHRRHRVAALHQPLELVVQGRLDRLHVRQSWPTMKSYSFSKPRVERRAVDMADHLSEGEQPVDVRDQERVVLLRRGTQGSQAVVGVSLLDHAPSPACGPLDPRREHRAPDRGHPLGLQTHSGPRLTVCRSEGSPAVVDQSPGPSTAFLVSSPRGKQ